MCVCVVYVQVKGTGNRMEKQRYEQTTNYYTLSTSQEAPTLACKVSPCVWPACKTKLNKPPRIVLIAGSSIKQG